MFANLVKITLRNIFKYKGYTFLNIFSLSLGITFTILIGVWVQNQLSYNRFHQNLDDLYLVITNADWGSLQTWKTTPGPLRDRMLEEVPEVKHATRLTWTQEKLFAVEDNVFKSSGIYVDEDFLSMFTFPILSGDIEDVLRTPNSIILCENLARKLFGTADPIGKTVVLEDSEEYIVHAVAENVPSNSEINFNWLAPWMDYAKTRDWTKTWGNISFRTYVQLNSNAQKDNVFQKINTGDEISEHSLEFFLQPLSETYLNSKFIAGKQSGGRIEYIRLFSAIAIFLLVIACINFMNLSTARSGRRAKEIGIRKVVGAKRRTLIGQFIGEIMILSTIALLFAIIMAKLLLVWFNTFYDKQIELNLTNPWFWCAALVLVIITGFLAGSYPAFLLSSFKPVKILKGDFLKMGNRSVTLRKALIIFQFTISVILIVSSLTIQSQINYIKEKNLGLDRKDLFYLTLEGDLYEKSETYKEELLASPDIQSVTFTSGNPMDISSSSGDLSWPGKSPEDVLLVAAMSVGEGFTKTMGVDLVAGRDFSQQFKSDSSNYVVNETLVKALDLKDPIGTKIDFWNGEGQIIGVMKDFHIESLHETIRPMVLCYTPENTWMAWIKPASGHTAQAISYTENLNKKMIPAYPFNYEFADDSFARQYYSESLTGKLANLFAFAAILISCLGLIGLVAYAAERRRKEIGIRKVLGAKIFGIVRLLAREFSKTILLALLIAIPLSIFLVKKWLNNFAYTIELSIWHFILPAILIVFIAWAAISWQTIKAALVNPVDTIREE